MFEPEKIAEHIRHYEQQNFLLATDGYSPSATISYHYGKEFFVFGEGGLHARQDDMLTDFREFKGRNILILTKSAPVMEQYTPYFKRVETKTFSVRETSFYLVLGYDFNYGQGRAGSCGFIPLGEDLVDFVGLLVGGERRSEGNKNEKS